MIQISNVSKHYGTFQVLTDCTTTIKKGEVVVVAKSISRIFLQNSINLGLKVVLCPSIEASEGDELEITDDAVRNVTTGKTFEQVGLNAAPWFEDASGNKLNTVGDVANLFKNRALPQIKAGKLIPLAITSAKRNPVLPNVPTVQEAGVPGYVYEQWLALFAPARTPPEIAVSILAELTATKYGYVIPAPVPLA